MKKNLQYFYITLVFFLAMALAGSKLVQNDDQTSEAGDSYVDIVSPPPQSLDQFYPPVSEQPVYLFSMLDMESSFTGIIVDLMEEDFENARANFEKFKQKYSSVSKLIPEWEKNFPMEPVEELEKSMLTGEKGKVMASFEGVGKVCNDCHMLNMVKVQQKYHWRDFETINVTDQVTKESITFSKLMQFLSMNFAGIAVNLEEGQVENAKKHFEQFKSRFISMKASCTHCHTSQRKYYVDESVQSYVNELGSALNEATVNQQKIGELSMKIGQENCGNCHLVHLPAAMTKLGWKTLEGMK